MEFKAILAAIKKYWLSLWSSSNTLYKIIDFKDKGQLTIRCKTSHSCFHIMLADIAFDLKILWGLHPVQACRLGVKYATQPYISTIINQQLTKTEPQSLGRFHLLYQERHGKIRYIDRKTNQTFIMAPEDIIDSNKIIKQFNSEQAFFIGLQAGLRQHRSKLK